MTYYKATRPNGTDFHTGTINYAAVLESGKQIRHPNYPARGDDASGYLSVSVSAADCTGFDWPARLFEVKPVKPWAPDRGDLPNKRACMSLKVLRELPAWQVFGPQGEQVAAILDKLRTHMEYPLARRLAAAWYDAAWDAARDAARDAAWYAAWDAARAAAWYAWDAAWATITRDIITADQYQTLAGPWESVMGEINA